MARIADDYWFGELDDEQGERTDEDREAGDGEQTAADGGPDGGSDAAETGGAAAETETDNRTGGVTMNASLEPEEGLFERIEARRAAEEADETASAEPEEADRTATDEFTSIGDVVAENLDDEDRGPDDDYDWSRTP